MRLESFRIRNCFGFWDSGEIDLGEPHNLVYFLGRNSSGKTSVLRGISHFEYGKIPQEHSNFANYERITGPRLLRARFSLDPSGDRRLSVDNLLDGVVQQVGSTGVEIKQGEDGFSVTVPPSSPNPSHAVSHVAALLDHIRDVYSALIEQVHAEGQVWIEKLPNGSYKFLAEEGQYESFKQRQESIGTLIRDMNSTRASGGHQQVPVDFSYIEGLLFMQFPEIFFFTDRFSLDEDLPRSLDLNKLQEGQENALLEAFVSLLDRQTLRNLFNAERQQRIRSLTNDIQEKLDALCERINTDASRGAADADFVRISVDRTRDVRIILVVDGKESYYEHLSDNTKFLIAYHIFQEDRDRKNYLPSILLFDEPNRGFHPSAEGKMLRFLEALGERGNQVLVTTHSQYLIDLDRLTAVRIMARGWDETLRVENTLYGGSSGASKDTLALQPVTDAIGLQYVDQLVTRDKVIVTEGYTELLYLRLFARLLDREEPNLAPVTGEGKTLTLISFLISQGISFKVALDSWKMKKTIQKAIPVADYSFYIVEEHLSVGADRSVGIEDFVSKDDFKMLLGRCGHAINDEHLSRVPNSEYAKSTGIKALVAREVYEANDLDKARFSEDTTKNFESLLSFCENDHWYKA